MRYYGDLAGNDEWSGQTCGLFPLDTPLPAPPPSVWHWLPPLQFIGGVFVCSHMCES